MNESRPYRVVSKTDPAAIAPEQSAPAPSAASSPDLPLHVAKILPSRSLSYPAGTVVRYYPYTWGEVEAINAQPLDMALEERYDFLMRGVETVKMDKYDLTLSDFLFVQLSRKIVSTGSTVFRVKFQCENPECRAVVTAPVDSDKLEFDYMPAQELPVQVELSNEEVYKFMPLTVKQFLDLIRQDQDTENGPVLLAAQCISHEFLKCVDTFKNSFSEDTQKLEWAIEQLEHSVAPVDLTCPKCKADSRQELDGWEAVILPFRHYRESAEDSAESRAS